MLYCIVPPVLRIDRLCCQFIQLDSLVIFFYRGEVVMSDGAPDFSYSKSIDRRALLLEAAQRLDALEGHLGSTSGEKAETAVAQQIREQAGDEAGFADIPLMYRITDEYWRSIGKQVPYDFTQLKEYYNFYWLDIPINLHPKSKWAFNKIDVQLEFNPYAPKDGTRPKAYQIFPDEHFVEFIKLHAQAEIQLGANLQFSAQLPTVSLSAGATPLPIVTDLAAGTADSISASLGAEIPQHIWSLKVDKITHAPPLTERPWWTLHGKEFSREHRPLLSVIVQILKETREFKIRAQMDVSRSFVYAPADLRQALEDLPLKIKDFIKKGTPLHVETLEEYPWDLARFL